MASRTRPEPRIPPVHQTAASADPEVDSIPWMAEGILAGFTGAALIAAFFGVLDLAAGRPLWTPHALGAGLFLGQAASPDASISPGLVGAYTAIHAWVFVSIGLIASFLLVGTRWPGTRAVRVLALATALFVAFGAMFAAFAALMGAQPHGFVRILVSNAVAALGMAWVMVLQRDRRRD